MKPKKFFDNRVVLIVVAVLFTHFSYADIFCVSTATELQNALFTAAFNGQDDQIQIIQGTYRGNFIYAASEAHNLTLEGGYTADYVSQVLEPSNTILDGNQNGSVFIFTNNETSNFEVDGLTVQNGLSDKGTKNGGGLYIYATAKINVILSNNIIENNTAQKEGGGAYIENADVTLSKNIVRGNTAQGGTGGGVSINSGSVTTIFNNTVTNNTVNGAGMVYGGGIYVGGPGSITIDSNIITDNTTKWQGGGIHVSAANGGVTVFVDNVITNNVADNDGGGVYSSPGYNGTVTFTRNSIMGNIAYYRGGGVYSFYNTTFINNTLLGNVANKDGGGVYSGGVDSFINNTINGNTANDLGGGLYINGDTITITNNSISKNTAESGGGIWFGLYHDFDSASIYNNIIWNNQATNQGHDLYINNDGNDNFVRSTVNIFHNDFDQSSSGTYITLPFPIDPSNLNNLDPLFVDASNGDYHLQATSPVIDMGDNNAPQLPLTDKEGNPRIVNGTVDMGAYEYGSHPSHPVPDIKANDSDGPVTLPQGDNLTITVALAPNEHEGEEADWWIKAGSPLGFYWYKYPNKWIKSLTPIRAYGGPLFNLSPYSILNISSLPIGEYDFEFSVDDNQDGQFDGTYSDSVLVTVE